MISEAEKKYLKVGFKQVLSSLNEGNARKVFLANDCDESFKKPIEEIAQRNNFDIFYIDTRKDLGRLCGIDVGASCAVVVNS